MNKTPLNEMHRESGGRLVEFAGWELPLHFGSQLEEHHAVRRNAGIFDVSHMTILDLEGENGNAFLRTVLANDIDALERSGQAQYGCLLNEQAGIVDDLMVFRRGHHRFRLITNAATRDKVMAWLQKHIASFSATMTLRSDLAMLAVQGPRAKNLTDGCFPTELREKLPFLKPFELTELDEWFIATTGYTGEEGYEIVLPLAEAPGLWRKLVAAGVKPCGLGARDTLRLEAGLRLYGLDMDETVSPLESGLGWTVAWQPEERIFIGREALEAQRQRGDLRRFVGLVLEDPGVLRSGQRVIVPNLGEGRVTSGGYSPTLDCSIAFARIPPGQDEYCQVEIRGQMKKARIISPRFIKR
jgi:aminomethyltransferase